MNQLLVSKIGLQIYGKNLPISDLSDAVGHAPFVVRGEHRQLLEASAPANATYCCYDFATRNPAVLSRKLWYFSRQFDRVLALLSNSRSVSKVTIHCPLHIDGEGFAVLSPEVLRRILSAKASLWLDLYFKNSADKIEPPESVLSSAPEGTYWYGGLVDLEWLKVAPLNITKSEAALQRYVAECMGAQPNELTAEEFGQKLYELGLKTEEQYAVYYLTSSYRSNRSIELSPGFLSDVVLSNLPLVIIATS